MKKSTKSGLEEFAQTKLDEQIINQRRKKQKAAETEAIERKKTNHSWTPEDYLVFLEVISQNLNKKNQLVTSLFTSKINSKNPKVPIDANNKSLQNKVRTLKNLAVSLHCRRATSIEDSKSSNWPGICFNS